MTDNRPYQGRTSRMQHGLILRVLQFQLAVAVLASGLLLVWAGKIAAYSGICGALIYLLPSFYQARKAFKPIGSSGAGQVLQDLYKSEIWKMALTMVMFGSTFALVRPLEPFSLFGVFVLLQLIAWSVPLFFRRKRKKNGLF